MTVSSQLRGVIKEMENPKQYAGERKVPMHLIPDGATLAMAMSFKEGARKYGPFNWRTTPVRASAYVGAVRRHLDAWWNGEDEDPDTGLSHLWKALSCIAVMVDAQLADSFHDDRPPPSPIGDLLEAYRDPL
jgi:hypothetical protein